MPKKPSIYLIAGCNGAGKTTFAREFLPTEARCFRFMNADELARGLSPLAPAQANLRAARLLLSEISDALALRESFGWETTLSGRGHAPILRHARRKFEIELHYLLIRDPATALRRIKKRVKEGGHDVPASDVLRRHRRSLDNLLGLYLPLADRWVIWDAELPKPMALLDSSSCDVDSVQHRIAL